MAAITRILAPPAIWFWIWLICWSTLLSAYWRSTVQPAPLSLVCSCSPSLIQRSKLRVGIVMPTLQAMVAALAELAPVVAVLAALQAVIETASAPTAKAVAIRLVRDIVFLSESRRQDTGTTPCRWERLP